MHCLGGLASANRAIFFAVMSEQPNSGVRNIRAMFEAKNESISPPSRGRSPVGSEGTRSTSSRPLSKVRTSFVAVERSGQTGPQLGLRKLSSSGDGFIGLDGSSDLKMGVSDTDPDYKESFIPQENGSIDTSHPVATIEEVKEEDTPNGPNQTVNNDKEDEKEPVTSNGSIDNTSDQQAPATPSSPKHEQSLEGLNDPASHTSNGIPDDLGSVLKGSPFGSNTSQHIRSNEDIPKDTKDETQKVPSATKAKLSGTAGIPTSARPKESFFRPLVIRTKKETEELPKGNTSKQSTKITKSPRGPRTPKTPNTTGTQSQPASSSPRQPLSKKSYSQKPPSSNVSTKVNTKDLPEATTKKSNRQFSASNAPKASTKPTTVSSSKPQPKSPTRPVRLPTAATAPTAASAAKIGGAPPSRSPSRASTIGTNVARKPSTLNKDRSMSKPRELADGSVSHLHKKSSRPSLPATERPKSRTSIAGRPSAGDEGFLARMMRPTASSANKAHEKNETKLLPQRIPIKPKRKSEIGHEEKPERTEAPFPVEAIAEQQEVERPPSPGAPPTESTPVFNEASEGV